MREGDLDPIGDRLAGELIECPHRPVYRGDDLITKLQQLGELKTAGVLDDAEFAAAKAKLLAR